MGIENCVERAAGDRTCLLCLTEPQTGRGASFDAIPDAAGGKDGQGPLNRMACGDMDGGSGPFAD
jgi:hypothetical protein